MVSRTSGGPFGLIDVVLPLFDDILRCLGHALVCMGSQLSDGEASLAFLSAGSVGVALGWWRWMAHSKNSFIYVRLLLQRTQNFHDGLDSKNTTGQPANLSVDGTVLPLRPGRFGET